MTSNQQPTQRHLDWEACYNARDLGGLPTIDGGQTRGQSVIRSDILGRLTAQGRRALIGYGVRTIIDLRSPKEAQGEHSAFTEPTGDTDEPAYLNLPLEKYYPHVSELINKAASLAEIYCIILDHYPDAVVDVMRTIANARPGGVVVHCHAGKDRTGIVSALLLGLAGVPAETIAADYAESQIRLWPLYEKIVAEVGGEEDPWLKPTATPETIHTMLAHVDTTYGGVCQYLEGAGLLPTEMERLKSRLRSA